MTAKVKMKTGALPKKQEVNLPPLFPFNTIQAASPLIAPLCPVNPSKSSHEPLSHTQNYTGPIELGVSYTS